MEVDQHLRNEGGYSHLPLDLLRAQLWIKKRVDRRIICDYCITVSIKDPNRTNGSDTSKRVNARQWDGTDFEVKLLTELRRKSAR